MNPIKLSDRITISIDDTGGLEMIHRYMIGPSSRESLTRDETSALTHALYEHREVAATLPTPARNLAVARLDLRQFMLLTYEVTLNGEDEMHLCGLVRAILEAEEENRKRVQKENP